VYDNRGVAALRHAARISEMSRLAIHSQRGSNDNWLWLPCHVKAYSTDMSVMEMKLAYQRINSSKEPGELCYEKIAHFMYFTMFDLGGDAHGVSAGSGFFQERLWARCAGFLPKNPR
jgi:hypothetical protein